MSNKNYRTYYGNQTNKYQKASRSYYYPKGRKFSNSSNLNSNEAIEVNFEPKKNQNSNNKNSEEITDMKLNIEAVEHFPNIEKLKNQENEKKGKKEREKIQKEKEEKIKNEYKYSYEYLIQFETWDISNQVERIPEEVIKHINEIREHLEEIEIFYPKDKVKNNYSNCNTSKSSSSSNISFSMEPWARKDYSKEIQEAEDNKKKFEELDKKDIIQKELRAILNIMTKDNYNENKSKILEIIKENIEYQEQFLEIFILKAVKEQSYAELYAKLCKYLNKTLPQKYKKSENSKMHSSIFRDKLIKKCREILKAQNFDNYMIGKELDEKEIELKKLVVGNVNFISELIKIKMLSKKIIPDCIDYLFKRYYEIENEKELKLIFAQSIIHLTGKFGTLIHSEKKNIKSEETQKFKENIEKIFIKLEKIKNDKDLPGHIKYQIINLIEKKKNNYKESKFEKSLKAKSKKELEEELEKKDIEKESEGLEGNDKEKNEIKEKIKKDLNEYKDFIEEEGNSEKYLWNVTTELYDVKLKKFDDILEGYIESSADFIEKNSNNIIYAKDYIKELIGYYASKINEEEKNDIQKRIFDLFEIVNDLAFETPKIYDIYSYVLFILIENNIMEIVNLVKFYKEDMNENDISLLNKVFKNICEYDESGLFKKNLKKFGFICKNKEVFKWVFF